MNAGAAPEVFTVTRYRCPFCRRSWQQRKRAERHIPECWYNHGCKTCGHAELEGGAFVIGCRAGVDLVAHDESYPGEPVVIRPRAQCPLWAAPVPGGRP